MGTCSTDYYNGTTYYGKGNQRCEVTASIDVCDVVQLCLLTVCSVQNDSKLHSFHDIHLQSTLKYRLWSGTQDVSPS